MKKIVTLFIPFLLTTACVDSLDDYNVDQKRAASVPAKTLFSNALKNITDIVTTPSVNSNNFRMFVQQWTTTTYLDEPRYSMTSRTYSASIWNALYRDALADLKEAKRLIALDESLVASEKNNQLAMIGIMEVYSWNILVNTFGGVPYREALDPTNLLPKYDNAETIYDDLLARLDASLAMITASSTSSFGTADLIYNGSMAKWEKFGNSLKLKMGMLLADKNSAKAKSTVESAAANVAKLIASNSDNGRFPYVAGSPNNNPISSNLNPSFTSREDFVAADKVVNEMNALNDPRRQFYFTQVNGAYVGGKYGFSNLYANFSHISTKIIAPTFEGLLLDYTEVEFLLAEAVERGFNVSGSAAAHYTNAVTASILYWGGTATDASTYLAQPAVAYATAVGSYKQKIGMQKWLALNNRGWEAWVEWRRLDYPIFTPPLVTLKIPVRMIYPSNEATLNTAPWEAAKAALGGDDSPDVKLFWDIN